MQRSYTKLYVHCVWGTWDRLPLITPEVETRLYAAITAKCRELKCEVIAIGGVADHVHLLVRLHPSVSVSELMKHVKGATSHLVTHEVSPGKPFQWSGVYGAFTVGIELLDRIAEYVRNQKAHHANKRLEETWEQMSEVYVPKDDTGGGKTPG
jgi:putative transposase